MAATTVEDHSIDANYIPNVLSVPQSMPMAAIWGRGPKYATEVILYRRYYVGVLADNICIPYDLSTSSEHS